ncbi:MAG: response regulator transcription factor [Woeseia sp.]|nr:response regulator transcription factor [Woeseia sp.]MBT8096681.1 response regulator transcription factor [Woeseia sp.]NNE61201.1 response regulator transcription factor [Woeseia sp.]NNL54082.1 response regulator transcription factor [Woeseia sp.]
MTIRIMIADDHQVLREGLRTLLEDPPRYRVTGTACDGREAVAMARKLNPDVVIIDIAMPELNGIDATKRMLADRPDLRVIALSMHSDKRYISGMLEAGALAYVRKESAFEEIAAAVDAVSKGEVFLGEGVASVVVNDYRRMMARKSSVEPDLLSIREREVLQLIAEGYKTSEIAARLCVSASTVETHRRQIMTKLDLDSVAALTKYAIRKGFIGLDD